MFGETDTPCAASGDCCDVCIASENGSIELADYHEELKILNDALEQIGNKGELKVSEWIRGSKIPWTNNYNKQCFSYGNHRGHDITFWRRFMKQCHVLSLVNYELKSIIKKSGFYAVNGIYPVAQNGVEKNEPLLDAVQINDKQKRVRSGKGSNIL